MTEGDRGAGGNPNDEILAGEYVIGVLSADARRMVERRLAEDEVFLKRVERWQNNLATFNDDYVDVRPDAAVLDRIKQRLFGSTSPVSTPTGLWNSTAFWRWLSLGTSVLAASAIIYASVVSTVPTRDAGIVAELSAPDNAINMLASYDADSGRMLLVPVAAGRLDEKSLELWLVPDQGDPLSLGVLPVDTGGELVIPEDLRAQIGDGAILAVTLEPFGGSPTGRATGPIVASGTARQL